MKNKKYIDPTAIIPTLVVLMNIDYQLVSFIDIMLKYRFWHYINAKRSVGTLSRHLEYSLMTERK